MQPYCRAVINPKMAKFPGPFRPQTQEQPGRREDGRVGRAPLFFKGRIMTRPKERQGLLARGRRLEYLTLGWN